MTKPVYQNHTTNKLLISKCQNWTVAFYRFFHVIPVTHFPPLKVSPALQTQIFPNGSNVSLHVHFLGASLLHSANRISLQACGEVIDPQLLPISAEKLFKSQHCRKFAWSVLSDYCLMDGNLKNSFQGPKHGFQLYKRVVLLNLSHSLPAVDDKQQIQYSHVFVSGKRY